LEAVEERKSLEGNVFRANERGKWRSPLSYNSGFKKGDAGAVSKTGTR
jgi:hypothetical protein